MNRRTVEPSNPGTGNDRWVLLAIVCAAFLAKLIVLLQLHEHPLLQPRAGLDDAEYLDLARRVAAGDFGLGDRVYYVSPFYIYFSALVLAGSGLSIFALRLAQIALGALSVWLIADLARGWYGVRGAWIAAALAALTGYFTFSEILISQSAVDGFLTAAGMWLLVRAWREPSMAGFLAAGVVLGLHTLNRPNVGIWAIAAVALTVSGARPKAQGPRTAVLITGTPGRLRLALLLAAGISLAMAPVAIRNYMVSGEIVPISSHGGLNFYIGNHENADGIYSQVPGVSPTLHGQTEDMQAVAGRALGHPVSDVDASGWFYGRAWEWIRHNPLDALRLFARKLGYAFSGAEIPLNDSYAFYRWDTATPLRALVVGPWLLLPLGLAGVWLGRPPDPGERAIWWRFCGSIAVFALSVAVFFVVGRYRLPILVVCCVTSAGAILALWQAWRAGDRRRLAIGAAMVVALGIFVNRPLAIDDGRAAWRAEMIVRQIERGEDADAEALVSKTESSHPNPGLLRYRTGKAYASVGKYAAAIPHFTRALEINSDRAEIHLDLGHSLVETGRGREALPHLRAAIAGKVQPDVAVMDLIKALKLVGDPAAALADIRGLAGEPLDPRAASALGRLSLELRDVPLAIQFLERARSQLPADAASHAALGIAYGLAGRHAEGLAALETAARLDAGNPSAHLNLAVAYASAGRIEDARREGREALRLRPDYPRAQEFLRALPRDHD